MEFSYSEINREICLTTSSAYCVTDSDSISFWDFSVHFNDPGHPNGSALFSIFLISLKDLRIDLSRNESWRSFYYFMFYSKSESI